MCTSRQCHETSEDQVLKQDRDEYGPYLAHTWFSLKTWKTSRLSIGCKVVPITRFHLHSYRIEKETVIVSKIACTSAGAGVGGGKGDANTGGKEPRDGTCRTPPKADSERPDFAQELFPALQGKRFLILFSRGATLYFREAWTHYQPQSESNLISAICGNSISLVRDRFENGPMTHF